jgi:hypothetical protein
VIVSETCPLYTSWQVELDMSETNHISSKSTLALAEHCKNLKMYGHTLRIHVINKSYTCTSLPFSRAMFESCVKLDGEGLVQVATIMFVVR